MSSAQSGAVESELTSSSTVAGLACEIRCRALNRYMTNTSQSSDSSAQRRTSSSDYSRASSWISDVYQAVYDTMRYNVAMHCITSIQSERVGVDSDTCGIG